VTAGMLAVLLLLAQAHGVPRASRFEISGAAVWIGGYDAGAASALETRNPSTGTAPLSLFTTDSRSLAAAGVEARLGWYLSRRVSLEGLVQVSRPVLRSRVSGDFESALPADVEATVTSYTIGGSALYHFGRGRIQPFVEGGAGYLRQLLEQNDGLVTGAELHAGGGLQYRLTNGKHPLSMRVDGMASVRTKTVAFDQKRRIVTAVAGGFAWRF
jgi:hypothetical protein